MNQNDLWFKPYKILPTSVTICSKISKCAKNQFLHKLSETIFFQVLWIICGLHTRKEREEFFRQLFLQVCYYTKVCLWWSWSGFILQGLFNSRINMVYTWVTSVIGGISAHWNGEMEMEPSYVTGTIQA